MIKGIALGVCISVFISSFVFLAANLTNSLKPNIITGAAIGTKAVANYSIIALALSTIVGFLIILSMRR